jgi:hypothetical protein
MPGNFTAGNTGVLEISAYPASPTGVTINGVTATKRQTQQVGGGNSVFAEIWVADNLSGGTATATVTVGAAGHYLAMAVTEYSGLATASYDTGTVNSGTGSGAATGTITSPTGAVADEVVLAVLATDSGTFGCVAAAGGSWTNKFLEADGANHNCGSGERQIVASTSATTTNWTLDIGNGGLGWAAVVVRLKAAGGSGLVDVDAGTDTPAVSDTLIAATDYIRSISDSSSVSDSLTPTATFERAGSDTASVTDVIVAGRDISVSTPGHRVVVSFID